MRFDNVLVNCVGFLLVALLLLLCLVFGALPAQFVGGGASSVLTYGLITASGMAVILVAVAFLFIRADISRGRLGIIIVGAVAFLASMYFPVDAVICGHKYAVNDRETAIALQSFAFEHYSEIDSNNDDLITAVDLEKPWSGLALTSEELSVLSYIRSHLNEIGHVVDSHTTYTTYAWNKTGKDSGYYSPKMAIVYVYGINRADIKGYSQRLIEKWKKW